MNKLPELFSHKMTWDAGIAPTVRNRILTQAICVHETRYAAEEGDYICGISGRDVTGEWNRLIYFARVDKILTGTDYYLNPRYWDRLDNVYRTLKSGQAVHLGPKYANYPPSDYFDSDIGSTGLLTDARILLS